MTVTIVAVVTVRFLVGVCDWTVDSDVGKGDFSLVLGILHLCEYAYVRSRGYSGLDCQCRSYHNFYFKAAFSEI